MPEKDGEKAPEIPPPPPPGIDPKIWPLLPAWIQSLYAVDTTSARIDASSTGTLNTLERVDSTVSDLLRRAPPAERTDLERVREDVRAAIDSARGAQGATRLLQDDVRRLRESLDEAKLETLSARVAELERLFRRHVKDHP